MAERRHVVRVDKQNVLRLQIGVGQSVVVQKFYGVAHLVGHVAHMIERIRLVVVFALCEWTAFRLDVLDIGRFFEGGNNTYQKIEDTESEHFECDAHVSVVIEPIQHFDAQTANRTKVL